MLGLVRASSHCSGLARSRRQTCLSMNIILVQD
jgi:hypothetical protein